MVSRDLHTNYDMIYGFW